MDRMARSVIGLLLIILLSGCALAREPSKTPRTAIEQLLLSHAIERSLADLTVPLSEGASAVVEVVGFGNVQPFQNTAQKPGLLYGFPSDFSYVRDAVAGHLGELGLQIRTHEGDAAYRIKVMVQSLGTEQGESFFGMPPVQSVLLPFALPELTLYKEQDQKAHMRYSLDIYETATGRLIGSTPWYIGSAYYHQYTILFAFRFISTDLILPP
jgi:hypothetical protein